MLIHELYEKSIITEAAGRRGFLKKLAGVMIAAQAPKSITDLLKTAQGVQSLTIDDGKAMMTAIMQHLSQWSGDDDDDYLEAHQFMAELLGFDEDSEDYHDLLDDYHDNPERAAATLINQIKKGVVTAKDIKGHFHSRADDPSDWRYQSQQKTQIISHALSKYFGNKLQDAVINRDVVKDVLKNLTSQMSKSSGQLQRKSPNALPPPTDIIADFQQNLGRDLSTHEVAVINREYDEISKNSP